MRKPITNEMLLGEWPDDSMWPPHVEVREVVLVEVTVRGTGDEMNRDVLYVFEKDGTLIAGHDPKREGDYHK